MTSLGARQTCTVTWGAELTAVTRGETGTSQGDSALVAALEAWAARPAPKPVDRTEDARRSLHDLVVGDLVLPAGPVALVPFRELALVRTPLSSAPTARPSSTSTTCRCCRASPRWCPRLVQKQPGKRRLVVVGARHHDESLGLPPLVYAAEKRRKSGAPWPASPRSRLPSGADADEAGLRRLALGAGILHLACHASVGATPADFRALSDAGPGR